MYIAYRSVENLNKAIIKNINLFPRDISLVVGIPRSGMLLANLIALYLNKPFTDIDSFIEGKIYSSGERGKFIDSNTYNKILVVDDSIGSGNALQKNQEKLKKISENFEIKYAVVYTSSKAKEMVDYFCEIIDFTRVFQWNIFHSSLMGNSCLDIDGVLCLDPEIDDDSTLYNEYISNATPLFIPTTKVNSLVTCRLEKYRGVTEAWLKKNNIKYDRLIMLNLPDKASRQAWGKHGEYKANVYKKSKCNLFVESSLSQAIIINQLANKPVFCTETFSMLNGNETLNKGKDLLKLKVRSKLRKFIPKHLLELMKKLKSNITK